MQKVLTIGLCVYCAAYAFEGAFRYALNLVGLDEFIFVRDAALLLPVALVGVQQFLARKLNPAYLVFLALVLLHGAVFVANFRLLPPALLGAKVLAGMLAGAVAADRLMNPSRPVVVFFMVLWLSAFLGIGLDKTGLVSFPWVGLRTTIGDVEVNVSRNWQIEQESDAYRAAGFMRSSIHAANLTPLLGLLLFFSLRAWKLRALVGVLTLPAVYWTTQKGSMVAYAVVLLVLLVRPQGVIPLRLTFVVFLLLSMALPLLLPGYYMPEASAGGFSNMSFNLRVEMMWPEAWVWIHRHEVFPFGVGLGGISGGQQLFAREDINAADNLFVFMYAYFGLMAVVYLGLTLWAYFRTPAKTASDRSALAVLLFIIIYGCVLSMLEDQMTALFTGAALGWIAYGRTERPTEEAKPLLDKLAQKAGEG